MFIISFSKVAFSQPDSTYKIRPDKAYIASGFKDTRDIFVAPFHWNAQKWLLTAEVLAATATIMTQDVTIHDFFQRNRSVFASEVSKHGLEPWGSAIYTSALYTGFLVYGELANENRFRRLAWLGYKTIVISAGVNYLVKEFFHRHRPYQVEGEVKNGQLAELSQYEWDGPISKLQYNSFPSGHTVSAFAMATILATEFKDSKWVPVVAYSVAGLTGLSRIYDNKHWASDVFMGAVFGWAMGKLISNRNNWGVNISPYKNSTSSGLILQMPLSFK